MKIKKLILSVAALVAEREIIDHGSIRMLYSSNAVREIESAEACDSVDTGTIGDDDLAEKLREIAENDQEGEIEWDDLCRLENAYRGDDVADYVTAEKEDELVMLDKLIEAAREVI